MTSVRLWTMTERTPPAVGAVLELKFLPPAVPRWQRGVVHHVDKDARCFYVFYAYEARGEDMYKVDFNCTSWRRIAKRKREAQIVGTGKTTPSQQIEKLKVKRTRGMGHGVVVVAEIAADSLIMRMEQPTAARSQRQVASRGLPHDSIVWLGNKGSRGVFDNALTAADARQRPSWHKMNHAWTHDLDTCNVEMRYDVEGLGWWARRKIAPPEQLRYDYGDAPSNWT